MDNRESIYRQRKRKKARKRRIKMIIRLCIIAILLFVAVFAAVKIINLDNGDVVASQNPEPKQIEEVNGEEPVNEEPSTEEPSTEEPSTEEPSTEEPEPIVEEPRTQETITKTVTLTKEDINKGYLILVNGTYSYIFPDNPDFVDTYDYKSKAYKFRDNGMMMDKTAAENLNNLLVDFYNETNNHNVIIISTYRGYDEQMRIYNNKVAYYGSVEEASKWVAYPGTSEHHTGLAVDLSIYTDDGESYNYTGEGEYAWINTNCTNYGFIVRYDSAKTDITNIAYEPWHFRYVGVPHAEIMAKYGLCHEEYISFLKAYPQNGNHLTYTTKDGSTYEIFYVQSEGDITEVKLPLDANYTVSGNNVDGFIFTVKTS